MRLPQLLLPALVLCVACASLPAAVAPSPPSPCPSPSAASAAQSPAAPAPLPVSVPDTPVEHALAQLFADAWEDELREAPVFASLNGDRRYNNRWSEVSAAAFARRNAHATEFLARVRAIPRDELSPPSRVNRDLFEKEEAEQVEGYPFGFAWMPVDQQSGPQTAANLGSILRFETLRDYEDWIRRLETFPAYVDQTIVVMREGMKRHILRPRMVMQRVPAQLDRLISGPVEQSPFFTPFTRFPAGIAPADRARLTAAAKRAVTARVRPAYQTLQTFLVKEYLPVCFDPAVGIDQIPRGNEAYAYLARRYTTTSLTPQEIHALGLREVARIRGEMQATMQKTGFQGSLLDFFAFLRKDPRFFYKTGDELLEAYRAIAKRIDPLLVKLFKTLPRTPYGVEPIPASLAPDTTTAYYMGAAEDGSRGGTYYVNLYKPEARPRWEMMALTLHESVPGHHLQLALQLEKGGLPEFRRNGGYTAFVEGWGLYAESLGDELGLYDDPYSKFGQLAYEMWRAIRLVVDTGMHVMKWDRQKAIDFFLENDPKAPLDVTNEIDRYIADPGQALAYKLGELEIKRLRAKAQADLGTAFDVREFHDVVLAEGAVPLDVLGRIVNDWVASKKTAPAH